MGYRMVLLFVLVGSLLVPQAYGSKAHQTDVVGYGGEISPSSSTADSSIPPLPHSCIGIGTPIAPVCCVSGYVYLEGKPVDDMVVQLDSGTHTVTTTTRYTEGSSYPFFSLSLHEAPLSMAVCQEVCKKNLAWHP